MNQSAATLMTNNIACRLALLMACALVARTAAAQTAALEEPFAAGTVAESTVSGSTVPENTVDANEPAAPRQSLPLGRRTNPDREATVDRRSGDQGAVDQRAGQPEPANRWQQLTRQPWVPVAGSLALVLVLFFALVAVLRRGMPAQGGKLPAAVLEVLGQATLAGKQQLHLLRCGDKLLLCCTTATGVQTLTEICEPAEVERLSALCRGGEKRRARTAPPKSTPEFGAEFGQEPAQHSFVRGLYRDTSSV